MVRLAQLYTESDVFDSYLSKSNFNKNAVCLVKIFTSILTPEKAVQVAKKIKAILPNASIVGASSSQAVLYNGKQLEHQTMVVIETFQRLQIKVAHFSFENNSEKELAQQIHNTFCPNGKEEPAVVQVLFSNTNIAPYSKQPFADVDVFVKEINQLSPTLKLVGGVAGDLFEQDIPGFVFDEDGVKEYGVIVFAATDDEMYDFVNVSNSMETISPVFEVTKTNDVFIEEVDGQPALEWIYHYLELEEDKLKSYNRIEDLIDHDYLLHFPLVIENTSSSGRFARYDDKYNQLGLHHSRLSNHTKFKIGYINPMKTVQEARAFCESVLDMPSEYLFGYICLFRKLYLNNCAQWELMPFQKHEICGIFLMGEIAFQNGQNNYHNGACVITGLGENEKYILPDIHCLDNTEQLKDDFRFLNKAKEKGKNYLQSKKENLVLQINTNTKPPENRLDEYMGLPNFYQFEEDKIEKNYDKLVLLESLTADSSIAVHGHQKYYMAIRDVISKVQAFFHQMKLDEAFKLYTLNYKTCILAASASVSEAFFLECTKNFYQRFEYVSSENEEISGLLRFVVVLNQKNLIEAGMNMLLANTNQDNNYLICDYMMESDQSVIEESKVINILNRAVKQKTVVPFYQGLRNNKTKKIDKYEALMRVVDSTGKVHTPFAFMEVAKKYKYYGRISQMMVERVLQDFKNREETVSLNVTLYDIQSEIFCNWLLNELETYPNPQRLVFEFVETENVHSVDLLADFVQKIRAKGCKIAIDDFGSGYSTLATVIALRPDYIKIDGSIIRNLLNNEESIIILNTIRYLAQQLGVETIAEFVETGELQQVVELYSISFSQGYYFSKPEPLENLSII